MTPLCRNERRHSWGIRGWMGFVLLVLAGCSGSSDEAAVTPSAAAAEVERAFQETPPQTRDQVQSASAALRAGDYETAIEGLHTARQGGEITMEQGMAVQRAMVAMELELMKAIEAGDEKAKRAYELLRQRNRN